MEQNKSKVTVGAVFTLRSREYAEHIENKLLKYIDTDKLLSRRYLNANENSVLLDAACGSGGLTLKIAKKVNFICGIDIAEGMIDICIARKKYDRVKNVFFVSGDVAKLVSLIKSQVPRGTVDGILCRFAFHHFDKPIQVLQNFREMLEDYGDRVVIIDPIASGIPKIDDYCSELSKIEDPTHIRHYTKKEWKEMGSQSGFDHTEIFDEGKLEMKYDEYRSWIGREILPTFINKLKGGRYDNDIRRYYEITEGKGPSYKLPLATIVLSK